MSYTLAARPSTPPTLLAVRRTLALTLLAVVTLTLWRFPGWQLLLAPLLVGYVALLATYRHAWLVVLPATLPLLDLAPWTGRFFFTEFDLLLLTTLAMSYWHPPATAKASAVAGRLLAALLAFSYLVSMLLFLLPLPPVDIGTFADYKTPFNALRVGKGFFWAWLLLPALREALRDNAGLLLLVGVCTGLGGAGLAVLWERGVIWDLAQAAPLAALQNLLDFTSSYRVTGLFSGMHVGGTAIDGYLALAVPSAAALLLFARSLRLRLLALATFGAGCYALVVTFSRALYLGFTVALAVLLLLVMLHYRRHAVLLIASLLTAGLASIVLVSGFELGGYKGLAAGILLLGGGLVGGLIGVYHAPAGALLTVLSALLFGLLGYDAVTTNRWHSPPTDTGLALLIGGAACLIAAGFTCGRGAARANAVVAALTALTVLAMVWAILIPASGGYRMIQRFSQTDEDLDHRFTHWQTALSMRSHGPIGALFGTGVGSFPSRYFWFRQGTEPLVNFSYEDLSGETRLRLGNGDFSVFQRVDLQPATDYRLRLEAFSRQPTKLSVKLCEKHLLFSERWTPNCVAMQFSFRGGVREYIDEPFNSGNLGAKGKFYWPTTLLLFNLTPGSEIEIDNVSLTDTGGGELLRNGDFYRGSDGWFFVSDFLHLAWHAKNLFVHLLFEQGWFGLAAFCVALIAALWRLLRAALSGNLLGLTLFPALAAFTTVGFFGTLIDMPRIATLFFLFLLTGLVLPGDSRHRPKRRRIRRVRVSPHTDRYTVTPAANAG